MAKLLQSEEEEVVILEKNVARCQLVWDELGSVVMLGDGTNETDLRRAGIARADTLVAVTGRDETNLVACQLAKDGFGVNRTVATIKDPGSQTIFEILGVDLVVDTEELILNTLERVVSDGRFNHLAYLGGQGAMLVRVKVPEGATAVGHSLAQVMTGERSGDTPVNDDVNLAQTFVSAVVRAGQPLQPRWELELLASDEVYAVTVPNEEQVLLSRLTEIRPWPSDSPI